MHSFSIVGDSILLQWCRSNICGGSSWIGDWSGGLLSNICHGWFLV